MNNLKEQIADDSARRRGLSQYRVYLKQQVNLQHRYFVLLLCLAGVLAVLASVAAMITAASWPNPIRLILVSLLSQAASMLVGCWSHRRELADVNLAEKEGFWPRKRDQRIRCSGRTCLLLNVLCLASALAAVLF